MIEPNAAQAADHGWTGVADTDWFNAANWDKNTVPTVTDQAFIDTGGAEIGTAGAQGSNVYVGRLGTGALTISGGGTLTSATGGIGVLVGSTGAVTIAGPGSSWASSGTMEMGYSGKGALSITNGGLLTSVGTGRIGQTTTGQGSVIIDGVGSKWSNNGDLSIGGSGAGSVAISNLGTLENSGNANIGSSNGSKGTVTIVGGGSSWINSGNLSVGGYGTGLPSISGGGAFQGAEVIVGNGSDSSGTAVVSGAGSSLQASGNIYVGDSGVGSLTIRNGGSVSSDNLQLGTTATGQGTILVDGANSSLTLHPFGTLTAGFRGTADITVSGGGIVSAGGIDLATDTSASANILVAGQGSKLEADGSVNIGVLGTGTLTAADGGTVKASNIVVANVGGGTGTLNIGNGGAAGILDAPTVSFGAGDGTINFNHTETNYNFEAVVSGTGTVNVLSGHTIFTANSSYAGLTTVSGGKLSVNGSILSHVAVTGGTLGGSGTVQSFAVGDGIIAPGNSIGTLSVAGNATFNSGSIFQVEVDSGGNSDLLEVGGFASLAGTLQVLPYPDYALGTTYTILTSVNGLTGTSFDNVIFGGGSIFIKPTLSYDANNVYMALTQTATFGDVALTPNQKAAASGADSLWAGNSIYDALLMLNDPTAARAAFDALSGETHASTQTILLEDSRFAREAALGRLRSAFGEVGADDISMREISDSLTVWGQSFGSWGTWDSDGNAAAMSRDIGGLFLGVDALVGDDFRVGFMGGYSQTAFSGTDRSSSGSSDSYTFGIYGGGQWNYGGGEIALRGGAA